MTILRNKEDKGQFLMALTGPLVMLSVFAIELNAIELLFAWFIVWLYISRHNHILHNHVHYPMSNYKTLNRLLNIALGFCTGMTSGNWKITHIHGHHVDHKVLNLKSRSYVKSFEITESGFTPKYAIVYCLKTTFYQFFIPLRIQVRNSLFTRGSRANYYRYYLSEFLLIYSVVGAFFVFYPLKSTIMFGLTYFLVFFNSRFADYVTHVNSSAADQHSFANVCLSRTYNKMFWNFGYHVAHHHSPNKHWTELPALQISLGVKTSSKVVAKSLNFLGFFHPLYHTWHSSLGNKT